MLLSLFQNYFNSRAFCNPHPNHHVPRNAINSTRYHTPREKVVLARSLCILDYEYIRSYTFVHCPLCFRIGNYCRSLFLPTNSFFFFFCQGPQCKVLIFGAPRDFTECHSTRLHTCWSCLSGILLAVVLFLSGVALASPPTYLHPHYYFIIHDRMIGTMCALFIILLYLLLRLSLSFLYQLLYCLSYIYVVLHTHII